MEPQDIFFNKAEYVQTVSASLLCYNDIFI